MKAKTWILLIVLLVAAFGAVWAMVAMSPGVKVKVAEVQRQPIREFIVERGKTRLPETHLITMPLDGRIEDIPLPEGTKVEKGQIVARMVPRDLRLEVEEATAVVQRLDAAIKENAEKNVEETALAQARQFVKSMRETVKAAYARVESGRAKYDYAEKNFGRVAPLAKTGAKTQDETRSGDHAEGAKRGRLPPGSTGPFGHGRFGGGHRSAADDDRAEHRQQGPPGGRPCPTKGRSDRPTSPNRAEPTTGRHDQSRRRRRTRAFSFTTSSSSAPPRSCWRSDDSRP